MCLNFLLPLIIQQFPNLKVLIFDSAINQFQRKFTIFTLKWNGVRQNGRYRWVWISVLLTVPHIFITSVFPRAAATATAALDMGERKM